MMTTGPQAMPTVGAIARRLGVPVHRVAYLLRARQRTPVGRAGNLRIFSEEDIHWVEAELRRIDAEKTSRSELPGRHPDGVI